MPDLSHERDRLYKLVDRWIEDQENKVQVDPDCEDCAKRIPQNARVATAALVVGVNYELPDFNPNRPDAVYQEIFTMSESKDGWSTAGLIQGAADILRAEQNPVMRVGWEADSHS